MQLYLYSNTDLVNYCYESHIKKSIDKNTYDDTLKFLNRFEKDELLINWFGGEPTLRMNEIHYFMQEVYKLKKFKNNIKYSY